MLVVITAVFLAALLAALCVVAIRGAVHALAPRPTEHHVAQGGFRPVAVIDATAKVIRSTAPKPRPWVGEGIDIGSDDPSGRPSDSNVLGIGPVNPANVLLKSR